MFRELNRITLTWWFGHALLLVLAIFVVGTALLMDPTPHAVSLFGFEIPVVCGYRRMTGMACMGCGLTRSFAFMAHGQLRDAFDMNWMGPLFFAVVAAQIPWRAVRLWQGPLRPDAPAPA